MQQVLDEPFFVSVDSLSLEAHATGQVVVQVLPFVPGVFRCQMVILSEEAGEFMYECIAKVGLPRPTESMKMSVLSLDDGSAVQRLLKIPNKNLAQEAAFNA